MCIGTTTRNSPIVGDSVVTMGPGEMGNSWKVVVPRVRRIGTEDRSPYEASINVGTKTQGYKELIERTPERDSRAGAEEAEGEKRPAGSPISRFLVAI